MLSDAGRFFNSSFKSYGVPLQNLAQRLRSVEAGDGARDSAAAARVVEPRLLAIGGVGEGRASASAVAMRLRDSGVRLLFGALGFDGREGALISFKQIVRNVRR